MEAVIKFSQMRNWRVVEAADSEGVRRQCLLLPMEMNGIFLSPNGHHPYMRFGVFKTNPGNSERYAYGFVPLIPHVIHEKLIEQNLASRDDKYFAKMCGGLRYKKNGK